MIDRAPLRLSAHVLAHLRAVAQGIAPGVASRRYLLNASDDGATLRAHRAAVDTASALARRAGLGPSWRLLRVAQLPDQAPAALPSLEEWAEAKGYQDFSEAELLPLYLEQNPTPTGGRKARQIERLRRARLALLDELASFVAQPPSLADPVKHWFPDDLAAHLQRAGFVQLGELRAAIAIGGRWWRGLPAYGPIKAAALADQVGALVGWPAAPAWRADDAGSARAAEAGELVESWIKARTQSAQTARAYRREVQRFLVWLLAERRRELAAVSADDCAAYIEFLRAVPAEWMSRRSAARFAPGWAPFAGQPTMASQRYALTVLNAFAAWAVRAGALPRNPWELVNLRLPDDAAPPATSRAFTPAAWAHLLAQIERMPAPAGARMAWLLAFAQATGLRPAELLRARRADVLARDDGVWLHVHGKGARNRLVPVPRSALAATERYFAARGLVFGAAHPNTPLLAVLAAPELPGADAPAVGVARPPDVAERRRRGFLSYSTLAPAFKRFARAAFTSLPLDEREAAYGASLHWLRHTHATRAAEGAVSPDVLQANLGHADPRTTAGYYRAQERRRAEQMERVFSDSPEGL